MAQQLPVSCRVFHSGGDLSRFSREQRRSFDMVPAYLRAAVVAFSGDVTSGRGNLATSTRQERSAVAGWLAKLQGTDQHQHWTGAFGRDAAGHYALIGFKFDRKETFGDDSRVLTEFIFVVPSYRKRGIARRLAQYAMWSEPSAWHHLTHWAYVELSNRYSQALHLHLDYRVLGQIPAANPTTIVYKRDRAPAIAPSPLSRIATTPTSASKLAILAKDRFKFTRFVRRG